MSVGLNPLAKQQALAEFLEEDKRQISVRHRRQHLEDTTGLEDTTALFRPTCAGFGSQASLGSGEKAFIKTTKHIYDCQKCHRHDTVPSTLD